MKAQLSGLWPRGLALRLALEPGLLSDIRSRLDAQRRSASLYDAPRYTRHLETAFLTMAQRARQGLAPESFGVPASID